MTTFSIWYTDQLLYIRTTWMIPGGAALREEDSSFVEDEEEEEEEIEEGIAEEERTTAMADPANLHVHPDAHHDEACRAGRYIRCRERLRWTRSKWKAVTIRLFFSR